MINFFILGGTGCDSLNLRTIEVRGSDAESHMVKRRMTDLIYVVSMETHLYE